MISNEKGLSLVFYLIIIMLIFGMPLAIYNYFKQYRIKQKEIQRLFQNWQQQLENSQDKIFYYRQSQYEFESRNPDIADQDFWDALDVLRERACIFKGQDYWLSQQYQ
ncbi:unnamed protein product [Paramecium pentaurelia]|uniref:Uncharacterized protein n=1 Tax=Paramecium pentaurelia TaxID=43138 RepID=A0A8S1WN79_9CILI|nr:unnamed protein product [Paramecium pentaurelia]